MDYTLMGAADLPPLPQEDSRIWDLEEYPNEEDGNRLSVYSLPKVKSLSSMSSLVSNASSQKSSYAELAEDEANEDVIRLEEPVAPSSKFPLHFKVHVAQLVSLLGYLGLLFKDAVLSESTNQSLVPLYFVNSQLFEYFPTMTDSMLSITTNLLARRTPRPKLRLIRNEPAVDLLIPVCKEPLDIVLDTIIAACRLDWPSDKLRIIICDDGKDDVLKAEIKSLREEYPFLHYCCRNKAQPNGYKAGNLNDVIKMLDDETTPWRPKSLDGQKAFPFLACIDADMIVDEAFIRALMAHMYLDEQIGMVGVPQDFYNIPVNDPLYDNLVFQHESDQISRDKADAAWCVGSGFIFRRSAHQAVGGFAEDSMCDDLLFGWTLNGHGWKTAHVNERLQTGLQPESFASHMKQRRRWFVGGARNSVWLKFGFNPHLKGMTGLQWMTVVNQLHKPFTATIFKAMAWSLITSCLWSGEPVVNPEGSVAWILFFYMTFFLLTRWTEHNGSKNVGYALIRRKGVVNTWQSLHLANAALREVLSWYLPIVPLGWQATGALEDVPIVALDERNPAEPRKHLGRLEELCYQESVWVYPVLFFTMLQPVYTTIANLVTGNEPFSSALNILITGVLFPGLHLEQIPALLSPVWYILFPPKMKKRRAYMSPDGEGTLRPMNEYRGVRWTKGMRILHIPYIVATVWVIFAWWYVVDMSYTDIIHMIIGFFRSIDDMFVSFFAGLSNRWTKVWDEYHILA